MDIKNLYQEFKGRNFRSVTLSSIKDEIIIRTADFEERICGNPFELNPQEFQLIDWWDVWNSISGLPNNIQIRVNAGEFGVTKIDQVAFFSYEQDISPIIEQIREYTGNSSSDTYLEGVIKTRPDKDDDGSPCSYYIDYVLYVEGNPIDSTEGAETPLDVEREEEIERAKRAKEADRKSRQEKIEKVKRAKKRKRPKSVAEIEKKTPKKKTKKKKEKKKKRKFESRDRVAEMREAKQLFQDGFIDKETLQKMLIEIVKKQQGGVI